MVELQGTVHSEMLKKVFGGKHIIPFCSVYFTSTEIIMHDSNENVTNSKLRTLGT